MGPRPTGLICAGFAEKAERLQREILAKDNDVGDRIIERVARILAEQIQSQDLLAKERFAARCDLHARLPIAVARADQRLIAAVIRPPYAFAAFLGTSGRMALLLRLRGQPRGRRSVRAAPAMSSMMADRNISWPVVAGTTR